jgi:hypothetical protein
MLVSFFRGSKQRALAPLGHSPSTDVGYTAPQRTRRATMLEQPQELGWMGPWVLVYDAAQEHYRQNGGFG